LRQKGSSKQEDVQKLFQRIRKAETEEDDWKVDLLLGDHFYDARRNQQRIDRQLVQQQNVLQLSELEIVPIVEPVEPIVEPVEPIVESVKPIVESVEPIVVTVVVPIVIEEDDELNVEASD
jgi:hypothetical protein